MRKEKRGTLNRFSSCENAMPSEKSKCEQQQIILIAILQFKPTNIGKLHYSHDSTIILNLVHTLGWIMILLESLFTFIMYAWFWFPPFVNFIFLFFFSAGDRSKTVSTKHAFWALGWVCGQNWRIFQQKWTTNVCTHRIRHFLCVHKLWQVI